MREVTEESFLRDVGEHKITVVHENGVYRHIHFAKPGSGDMHFDLITWPWHLCYSGDMGTYVFSRLNDMFEFFRVNPNRKPEGLHINPGYWSEKLDAIDRPDGYEEWDKASFEEYVNDWLKEVEADDALRERVTDEVLSYADEGEVSARNALMDFEHDGEYPFEDSWECGFKDYTFRFIWCCYALTWGIRKYDELTAVGKTEGNK